MKVLLCLVAHQGHLVERATLFEAVWPDIVVGEDALNRAISQLRKALGDQSEHPQYIETIRKKGYRCVATIDHDQPKDSSTKQLQKSWPWFPILWVGSALAMFSWILLSSLNTHQQIVIQPPRPLTALPGVESRPSFASGDSNNMVFSWNGQGNFDIHLRQDGTTQTKRLTDHPADDLSPIWSPDNLTIAFIRKTKTGAEILTTQVDGGNEQVLWRTNGYAPLDLAWQPQGNNLVFSHRPMANHPITLFKIDLAMEQVESLTHPGPGQLGDRFPSFSPDGDHLAFVRINLAGEPEVFKINLMDEPVPKPIPFDCEKITGLAWLPDGRHLAFTGYRDGHAGLWKVPITGGEPSWLADSGATSLAVTSQGNLAYEKPSQRKDLWIQTNPAISKPSEPMPFHHSTAWEGLARFSPDGNNVAFLTNRSGMRELWLASLNGGEPRRVGSAATPFPSAPTWSPEGDSLCFSSRQGSTQTQLWQFHLSTGTLSQLTHTNGEKLAPSYSRDGQWLYFASFSQAGLKLVKVPIQGGETVQVVNGGFYAQEAMDGRTLYFTKFRQKGIWKIEAAGMDPQLVISDLEAKAQFQWQVFSDGIYFFNQAGSKTGVWVWDQKSKQTSHLWMPPDRVSEVAFSHDGQWLIYGRRTPPESDIMLLQMAKR